MRTTNLKHVLSFLFALLIVFSTSCKKDKAEPQDETVTDIDGNVYKTVKIGNQVWMAEDLKVTRLNDGTYIPRFVDNDEWRQLQTPGRCEYDNNTGNLDSLGRLYNWYAVNTGKLAPEGWHVPTNEEIKIMINYLIDNGYNYDGSTEDNKIAKSLAATWGWRFNETIGTPGNTDYPEFRNKSGLSFIGTGYRSQNGTFSLKGFHYVMWASDQFQSSTDLSCANEMYIHFSRPDMGTGVYSFNYGLSVRCIKD